VGWPWQESLANTDTTAVDHNTDLIFPTTEFFLPTVEKWSVCLINSKGEAIPIHMRQYCRGARQNQPARGASKPANVLMHSIPHPFRPLQLFLELLVPAQSV
jgi:hypothetical protein